MDGVVYDINDIQLICDIIFSYILTDFLCVGAIHFWERGVEVSNYDSEHISFFFFLSTPMAYASSQDRDLANVTAATQVATVTMPDP